MSTLLGSNLASPGRVWSLPPMDVTQKLVKLFSVDKQLRGLQTRLRGAERFLAEQESQLAAITAKKTELETQQKQFAAAAKNQEGEVARVDAKMATIREAMNVAQTNKEYKGHLTEVNTFKAERDRAEQAALEHMQKADELKADLARLATEQDERKKMRAVAVEDKAKRAEEIKDRLAELKAERVTLAAEVNKSTLAMFERLIETRGDEAMATVEIVDRKRHDFNCGACRMGLPVESVSGLLGSGKLTTCVSCGCILFIDDEVSKAMQPPEKEKKQPGSKKVSAAAKQ